MNCPSVNYDIVSGIKPVLRDASIKNLRESDAKISFKKKAIAEFSDLGKLYHPNFNATYKVRSAHTGVPGQRQVRLPAAGRALREHRGQGLQERRRPQALLQLPGVGARVLS